MDSYGAHMLALWQGGEIELSGTQHCCSLVTPTPAEWVKIRDHRRDVYTEFFIKRK